MALPRQPNDFKIQLKNKRIKTLAQDVLNQPSTTGQLWDTLYLDEDDIEAPNYWDILSRPLQTDDEVFIRLHGSDNDDIIIHNGLKAVCAYAAKISPYDYVSQLYLINPLNGEFFVSGTFKNINESAQTYTLTNNVGSYAVGPFHQVDRFRRIVFFYDGAAAIADAIEIAVYDGTGGGAAIASGSIPAGSTKGTAVELPVMLAEGGTMEDFTITVTTVNVYPTPINVHAFTIMSSQPLP
jgi:hypothetical protein